MGCTLVAPIPQKSQRTSQRVWSQLPYVKDGEADVHVLLLLLRTMLEKCDDRLQSVYSGCFMGVLRLWRPMDPGRHISVYGTDSGATVEV